MMDKRNVAGMLPPDCALSLSGVRGQMPWCAHAGSVRRTPTGWEFRHGAQIRVFADAKLADGIWPVAEWLDTAHKG